MLLDDKRVPKLINEFEIGLDRGMKLYGLGMCGGEGDIKGEKPWFGDIIGVMKYNAWEKLKGVP